MEASLTRLKIAAATLTGDNMIVLLAAATQNRQMS